ncbi:uncharacterized protein BCR38DRAFT_471739 [Pseudomassariella vexata]|uniref:Major facilitator superfamily domain-containing protein n=1 Tax=Pseudomassariella vexata TaxID=1141098 RepID=A0A1Y2EGR4_9PEZI|nr:uncharacterized protein BCR38DRAFT_471739 [Pseudomassariella vexata]ORY70446.1 hypothetical protein BCR38DRAFT_471739 [Pseudomassariella vexata]
MATDENTPLLNNGHARQHESSAPNGNGTVHIDNKATKPWWFATPELRLLASGILISMSFSYTQVPIMYAFRQMVCDDFYTHVPAYEGAGDRCSRNDIDSATALQMTIMGMSTVCCGVLNLILTGSYIKRWGPRRALVLSTFFPILRVSMQIIGIGVGGLTGVVIMQSSQALSIAGGPAGYILILNTAIAEVVEPAARTGAFGKLQGVVMFGVSLGYQIGGIIGEISIIRRPFELAAVSLTLSCLYAAFIVPYIDPKTLGGSDKKSAGSAEKSKFFLAVFAPQRLRLENGKVVKYYGMLLLAVGIFTSVLATGYAPVLIQMYAMTALHFTPKDTSTLVAANSLIRGAFLMFIFPHVITYGRKWFSSKDAPQAEATVEAGMPTHAEDLDPITGVQSELEPTRAPAPVSEDSGAAFDLFFLRWSLLFDAIITACIAFCTESWQLYLAGFLLPFASGSAPASKGVLAEMCPASQRPDALQAMTFVEYVGVLVTLGVFGFVFSIFSDMGKAYLTFYCNAGVALIAIAILLFSRLPPKNSSVEIEESGNTERSTEDVATS